MGIPNGGRRQWWRGFEREEGLIPAQSRRSWGLILARMSAVQGALVLLVGACKRGMERSAVEILARVLSLALAEDWGRVLEEGGVKLEGKWSLQMRKRM